MCQSAIRPAGARPDPLQVADVRPIIIISNEYTYGREAASTFIEAGADAFFPMPFELEHLGLALVGCGIKLKD